MVHGSLDVTGESVSLVSRYPPRRSGASKQENWMKPACSTNGMAKFPIISALWIYLYLYLYIYIYISMDHPLHSIFWRYQPFFLAAKPGHPGHPGAILPWCAWTYSCHRPHVCRERVYTQTQPSPLHRSKRYLVAAARHEKSLGREWQSTGWWKSLSQNSS